MTGSSPLLTALVALAAALIAVWLTHRYQARRDSKTDERGLRDKKADRLRQIYAQLLLTAHDMQARALQWRWYPHDRTATADQKQQRIRELLEAARIEIDKTQVSLRLESGAQSAEVLAIFNRINDALTDFSSHIISNIQHPDSVPIETINALMKSIRSGCVELEESASRDLAELQKPI